MIVTWLFYSFLNVWLVLGQILAFYNFPKVLVQIKLYSLSWNLKLANNYFKLTILSFSQKFSQTFSLFLASSARVSVITFNSTTKIHFTKLLPNLSHILLRLYIVKLENRTQMLVNATVSMVSLFLTCYLWIGSFRLKLKVYFFNKAHQPQFQNS